MRAKKPLPQVRNGQGDEAMCLKYYEEVLRQEAFNQLPFDDPIEFVNELLKTLHSEFDQIGIRQSSVKDPSEYAKTVGRGSITQSEYLDYLGKVGFNTESLSQGVAVEEMREKCLDGIKAKAEAFFRIFMGEKFDEVDGFVRIVSQEDIDKYIDNLSIYHFIKLVVANAASAEARLKALKGHGDNHAAKAKVFAWCDTNMTRFSSMDDAALDIAETFVPQKFRAVRGWMTEWKKLRSAGTP